MKCLQCGSDDIVKNVRIIDRGEDNRKHDLVLANPGAWNLNDIKEGRLRANVCAQCGFVMTTVSKSYAQTLKTSAEKRKRARAKRTPKNRIT